jgi:hypothetical protein
LKSKIEENDEQSEIIKEVYYGGKGQKKVKLYSQREKFLATHLLHKGWIEASDKDKFDMEATMEQYK